MSSRIIPALSPLLALGAAIATGCAGAFVPIQAADALLPPEQEAQLGEQVDQELRRELRFLEDPQVLAYVRRIGGRVAAPSAEERGVDVVFDVVDDPENVNAFATLGGRIYVFSGLLLTVDTEAELASVLAHEVAHVTHRDVARLLIAQVGLSTLAQAALGREPGVVQQIAAEIAGAGVLASHTREQERDADQAGLRTLAAAGYDPRAMVSMYEKLEALSEVRPNVVQQFFATHPPTGDRIEAISAAIEQLPRARGEVGRPAHAAIERRLQQYYAEQDRAVAIGPAEPRAPR